MKKIAITGTIGSGKSAVSQILKELGYPVFDCDRASYELSLPKLPAWKKIVDTFHDITYEDGQINRKKLASIVFGDAEARAQLEQILHPAILELMNEACSKTEGFFFAEVPTLFESGWEIYFDGVLLVIVDDAVRMNRLMQNRSMTIEQIEERKAVQMSEEQKIKKAKWIIENNGTSEELKIKIKQWLDELERG